MDGVYLLAGKIFMAMISGRRGGRLHSLPRWAILKQQALGERVILTQRLR
jgi:hypothetical protein